MFHMEQTGHKKAPPQRGNLTDSRPYRRDTFYNVPRGEDVLTLAALFSFSLTVFSMPSFIALLRARFRASGVRSLGASLMRTPPKKLS